MRVAHRHEYAIGQRLAVGQELRLVLQHGGEHVNGHAADGTVGIDGQFQHLDARRGEQAHPRLVGQAALIHILANAAAGIAAHQPLRAVGIENAHGEIGLGRFGAPDEHQAVAADAHVGAAPGDGCGLGIGDGTLRGIDKDIVIAHTVHLHEVDSVGVVLVHGYR